jgi:hypothetical protein
LTIDFVFFTKVLYNACLLFLVMSMKIKLCSEIEAFFVEVYSDDDSTELSVTACVREGEKDVRLDFSFFIEILDDDLNFMMFDDGYWSVEYVYGFEEKSWFPDVLSVSDSLVFDGSVLNLVKLE